MSEEPKKVYSPEDTSAWKGDGSLAWCQWWQHTIDLGYEDLLKILHEHHEHLHWNDTVSYVMNHYSRT